MIRRGLSLVEALLAMALVLVIVVALYRVSVELSGSQRALGERVSAAAGVSDLFGMVEQAAAAGIAAAPGGGEAGVRGGAETVSIAHRRGGRVFRDTFRMDAGSGRVLLSRAELTRDAAGTGPVVEELLVEGVSRVRFAYLFGGERRESFDSVAASGLPTAIEVAVWMRRHGDPAVGSDGGGTDAEALDRPPDRLRLVVCEPGGGA